MSSTKGLAAITLAVANARGLIDYDAPVARHWPEFAFADPDAHLGYAYVMNKLDFYLADDPREKSLRDAVYRAIARAR